ncbi:hypothetical protein E4J49_24035 [Vibrio parahaemolyticus]|uniref:hypothetical protein n=1 Tax=Vibrio parahaemolyticus TaxID=670 RepID=UPI001DA0DAF1|nr:hypothetical protein [Vibrio parahaemolyticus]HDI3182390.1 hypothetical protein [Vibrio cholerae]HDY7479020.1 hypothetical protein [Vibrio vulnificus]EGQ9889073.1 hypothetical protein [Vibrio parahaemolyticus]EGR0534954.1 hypothetical protein [Vibrio parahaemolyticus]EGR0656108.1 hypothetical protein [Vibrio parahaemolyticus]
MSKLTKNKIVTVSAATAAALASASSFAAVDATVQAGLDNLVATGTELSAAGLSAIIALGVVSVGIAVVIGILRWVKRSATN